MGNTHSLKESLTFHSTSATTLMLFDYIRDKEISSSLNRFEEDINLNGNVLIVLLCTFVYHKLTPLLHVQVCKCVKRNEENP